MTKKYMNFSLDNKVSRVSRPSAFDRIVKEIDAEEIPAKYIEMVLVQYHDGDVVELRGTELTQPIPMNKASSWGKMEESFKKMRDVRVFIDTNRLEIDVNAMVEDYLGKYC